MNFAALVKQSRPIAVEFGGETLHLTYRPNLIDGHMLVKLRTADPANGLQATVDLLFALITEWDMNSDGEPVPLSADALLSLPGTLMDGLAGAILEDFAAGKVTAPSSNGSAAAVMAGSPTRS